MLMRNSNTLKTILFSTLCMIWSVASADSMMKEEGKMMMESSEKAMDMDKTHSMKKKENMKTMEGDMKAMEADMDMEKKDKMDSKEMMKEEGKMMMDDMKK